jgi:hypothetical protein
MTSRRGSLSSKRTSSQGSDLETGAFPNAVCGTLEAIESKFVITIIDMLGA